MSWLKRILLNSLLLVSILILPWWVAAILIIWYIWKFDMLEVLFYALIMDILYASYESLGAIHFPLIFGLGFGLTIPSLPIFTIITALILYILSLVKKRIRF